MKSKLGRYVAGILVAAILSVSAAPAMADTLYVRYNECRIDAYSMYNNLSNYHLYTYYAGIFYKVHLSMLKEASRYEKKHPLHKLYLSLANTYRQIYYFYSQYSFNFLINYLYSMMYLYFCEYWRPRSAVADLQQ